MSDNENEDIEEVPFLEEEDDNDDFSVVENKNKILEKNNVQIEKANDEIIDKIIRIHEEYGIINDALFKEIEKCIKYKIIIDLDLIKLLAEFASKANSSEKAEVLKEFYIFISDEEFEEDQLVIIRKLIPDILKKFDDKIEEINFREILIQMKIKIILKILDIEDKYINNIITRCIEKDWKLSSIKTFQVKLKNLIPNDEKNYKDKNELEKIKIENEQKKKIIESLLDTITAFPMNNLVLDMNEIDFTKKETIARDFYLKCATKSNCLKKALDTNELLIALENKNLNYFSKEKIEEFRYQINKAKNTIKPDNYKEWLKNFEKYDFKSKKKDYIAETIGVISHALKDTRGFHLREAQILSVLIFIDNNESQKDEDNMIIENNNIDEQKKIKKDNGKGIIEEISTGEGKSAIISCLSAYYGLRGHKVDIITSSRTLASRDSMEFKEFYNIFDLIVDYVRDYQPAPYKANITYGTFLDFEGDFLDEICYNNEIRGNRPYDIIIIDEVDNAFIDCIYHSTQLTHPSKGYQFLIPLYVSIYMMIDLLDHMYLEETIKNFNDFFEKDEYKNLDENSKRNIYEELIDNRERKDVFSKYIQKLFDDMKNEMIQNDSNLSEEFKGEKGDINKIMDKMKEASTPEGLKKYLQVPNFLFDFIQVQMDSWTSSAYSAKNLLNKEIDYTISCKSFDGYENITPIDRKNTGELEFNTVYRDGLHQMLQIKENLRVKPENLTHTFLSHINYFVKFKKKNFFGLTGTIGGEETYSIYKRDSFKSNLVFIPSYIAKRFIELPPIICEKNSEIHLNKICDEIFFHFQKGRKILIICKDIKEGLNIENRLQKDKYVAEEPSIKRYIILYVRNDIQDLEEELKNIEKRIIISTNLGGRGTDIKTSPQQEKNGGLHVIITKLSSNSRTQKQAFGRTSRQGNKGSGQYIIMDNKNLKTYEKLINERNKKEKKIIDNINVDNLLLKDELFQEYIKFLKQYPEFKKSDCINIQSEIEERWSFFLKRNFKDDIDEKKIRINFDIFKTEIEKIMRLPRYKRYNNDFLRITDVLKIKTDSYKEYYNFLNFKNCEECFYFAASYIKSFLECCQYNGKFKDDYKDKSKHCQNIIKYLKLAKKQVEKLIEINIEPTLRSVVNFGKITGNKYFKKIDNYNQTEFYKQFETRKKILNNLIQHFDKNIYVTEEYIRDYLPKNSSSVRVELRKEIIKMNKCLMLEDNEVKDLDYLRDAGFEFTYELTIKKPIHRRNILYYLISLGYYISFIIPIIPLDLTDYLDEKRNNYTNILYVDVHQEQSLLQKIIDTFKELFDFGGNDENENENDININQQNQNEIRNENNGNKNQNVDKKNPENLSKIEFIELKERTLKEMKGKIDEFFNLKIEEIKEELKFLVFIDYYFNEKNWFNIIKNITVNNFNTYDKLLQKEKIIKLFNKEFQSEEAKKLLYVEIENILNNIIKEIKSEFNDEKYDNNKVKRLEHIFIRKKLGDINYDIAKDIVNQIFSQNIINNDGKFNIKLFKEINNNEKNKKPKEQNVKIFYDIPYPKEITYIKNIDEFKLKKNFELNIEHDLILQDVQKFYFSKNYPNSELRLFKDFTNGIKALIIEIYEFSTEDISEKYESFISYLREIIYNKVEDYLKKEIFPNVLILKSKNKKKKLNEEEQRVVNLINENSSKKTLDIMKSQNLKMLFQ